MHRDPVGDPDERRHLPPLGPGHHRPHRPEAEAPGAQPHRALAASDLPQDPARRERLREPGRRPAAQRSVSAVVVLGLAGAWWMLSARKLFTGPKVQGSADEPASIERELTGN
ncbi:hypothetical protein [Streptomyces mirabilis]|uniref:hypothetical protein n=1 Tax=Streptomyces mirabilis TaxID=68239 RepID=UPI0011C39A2E|nr:hypothetical protein [Streptomyces mirabilis]